MLYSVKEVGYFHTTRKLEALLVRKSTISLFLTHQVSFAKVIIIAIHTGQCTSDNDYRNSSNK